MKLDPEEIEKKTIAELVQLENKQILEIGCGDGRITEFLIKPDNFIVGIDLDEEKVKKTRAKFKGYHFVAGDVKQFEFQSKFDLIIFSMSLLHVGFGSIEKINLLKKVKDWFSDKGTILVIEPDLKSQISFLANAFDDEYSKIRDALNAIKSCGLKVDQTETITTKWYFNSLDEFCRMFLSTGQRLYSINNINKIKKCLSEIKIDVNGPFELEDIINYFLLN